MFDISWSEFLLIGVVALVVIGPKELPTVLRTLGQWTRKVRGMASEFQNQFHEAMREAEMADLKKEVDSLARDVKGFNPIKDVHDDFRGLGEDLKQSLAANPQPAAAQEAALPAVGTEPGLTQPAAEPLPVVPETAAPPAADAPATPAALSEQASGEEASAEEAYSKQAAHALESAAAQPEAASKDDADKPAPADVTGRTG
jgi:sec-independent protein translocase protein TatB